MHDLVEAASAPTLRKQFGRTLDRAEAIYLEILRAVILIIATGLLAYAAWLGLWSLWKMAQSPSSVVEAPAVVVADELVNAEAQERAMPKQEGQQINPAQRRYYADFVKRYYGLFRTRFEPFRQQEDKQLTRDQFDDAFIESGARLQAAAKGELDFENDRADLEALLNVMTEAAGKQQTQQRLQKYKAATKVRVAKKVQRSRTEYRNGWDRYSTSCEDWYYQPYGCAVRRAVQVPYSETVYSMEFPEGTQSHTQIFRAFQDRFFSLLNERRESNRARAQRERDEISLGNIEGRLTLWTALQISSGFLALMFFFLLIAVERHQRRIAAHDGLSDLG